MEDTLRPEACHGERIHGERIHAERTHAEITHGEITHAEDKATVEVEGILAALSTVAQAVNRASPASPVNQANQASPAGPERAVTLEREATLTRDSGETDLTLTADTDASDSVAAYTNSYE